MNVYRKKLSWIDQKKNLGLTLCYVNLFEYEIDFGEKCCVQIDIISGTSVNINDAKKKTQQQTLL